MNTKAKEDLLDKMVQIWACKQRSMMSLQPAQVGHHIVRRDVHLLRWNMLNIMPLTNKEHRFIHKSRPRAWQYLGVDLKEYLLANQVLDFKNYLLEVGKTYDEFLDDKIEYWRGEV